MARFKGRRSMEITLTIISMRFKEITPTINIIICIF